MEHFDYKEFELEWLLSFSPEPRETIVSNAVAGSKISRQMNVTLVMDSSVNEEYHLP